MPVVLRIIPDGIRFDFVRYGRIALALSIIMTLASLVFIGVKGVELGTDFTGGVVVHFELQDGTTDAEHVKSTLMSAGLDGISVQGFKENDQEFMVVFRGKRSSESHAAVDIVKSALSVLGDVTYKKLDYVGAQIGAEQVRSGVIAVLSALACMFVYLCVRFRWQFAIGGVVALIHDVVLTMGMVSVTGLEFSLPAMAAVLMIIGYSVNDSVVIYDRVRELMTNHKISDAKYVVNASINSTLSRTLLTSGTTLLAALPLILMCDGAVRDLGIIAFCGVVVGTYSSIFVSTIPFTSSIQRVLK